jgi:hypothetical protein
MKKPIKFSYKRYKGEFYPIINVFLGKKPNIIETEAYIDSGASISIFLDVLAPKIGIKDYTKGKISYIMVGDGSYIPVYIHTVPIKIGYFSFSAKIGFSSHLGAGFNLLGQKDIFDRFVISFDKRNKVIYFKPY